MRERLTHDHFTGRAQAKLMGMSQSWLNSEDNTNWLDRERHTVKDLLTEHEVERQRTGQLGKKLGEHCNEIRIVEARRMLNIVDRALK